MDAYKIPKGYHIQKIEEIIYNRAFGYKGVHHITPIKYLKPGSYVMVKPASYFENEDREAIYGFDDYMYEACGRVLQIQHILPSMEQYSNYIHEIIFKVPEFASDEERVWFETHIICWSWNNEMVVPLIKNDRNVKI